MSRVLNRSRPAPSLPNATNSGEVFTALMASRPGNLKRIVPVALERPRRYDVVTTPEFSELKRGILADIRQETLKVMALEGV